jgi:hypothetical protein
MPPPVLLQLRGRALAVAVAVALALALALGLGVSGCGVALGGRRSPAMTAASATVASASAVSGGAMSRSATTAGARAAVARADRTHEYPTPAPRQAVIGGWRTPVEAVQVFATTYINWSAATVSTRLRALAEVSVGQARSAMSLAASETAQDYELHRGGIANSGVVEAIAPVRGHRDQYAVVTREQTTATNTGAYRGLAATWHVSLATVTRVQGGLWALSDWQPES